MSKLSKMQSLKQQRKYRNETIHILNHMNSKINPTLADRSLHNIKAVRPEVQSSRIARPTQVNVNKIGRLDFSCNNAGSKDKNQKVYQMAEKLSAKSLESRQGSLATNRKSNQKTKKNSQTRLHTQMANICLTKDWQKSGDRCQNDVERRLKKIQAIFNNKLSKQNVSPQSPSKLKKDFIKIELSISSIDTKINDTNRKFNVNPVEMICELNKKFVTFENMLQQRKDRLLYDDIDKTLSNIMKQLHLQFLSVIDRLLHQNEQKLLDVQMSIQKMISDHQQEIKKYARKIQKVKENYVDQIQQMLIRSLYVTDKINTLQEQGRLNFEKQARRIDNDERSWSHDEQSQIEHTQYYQDDQNNNEQSNFSSQATDRQYEYQQHVQLKQKVQKLDHGLIKVQNKLNQFNSSLGNRRVL